MLDSVRAVRQRLYILTLLALLASAATLALAAHTARQGFASTAGHVLVMDAGSSGTRMYAYSWRPAAPRTGGAPRLEAVLSTAAPHKVPRRALPDKRAYQRVETEPGLDAFADDPAALQAKALGGCCSWHRVWLERRCTLALSNAAALLCGVGHERPVLCCALAKLWDTALFLPLVCRPAAGVGRGCGAAVAPAPHARLPLWHRWAAQAQVRLQ